MTDPFDLWLRRSLKERWGAVEDEEVPEDLLRLCSDDRSEMERTRQRWRAEEPSSGE